MDLILRLKNLVAEERRITAELLQLLLRIEDQKLYAERGFSSLFELCVKELGYSEGAAYRRVSAMRLLRREESCAERIASGELSLSAAAKVETVFRQARKQGVEIQEEKKAELFQAALGASSREAEKKIRQVAQASGVEMPQGSPVPRSLEEKLQKLRALLSHQLPTVTDEELLHLVLDEALAKREKKQGDIAAEVRSPQERHVAEKLRAAIFARDGSRCSYQDPLSGRRCEGRHFLELDHIRPLALGGDTEAKNLRVLCRTHNQLLAAQAGLKRPVIRASARR